jgi:hypothetical protein
MSLAALDRVASCGWTLLRGECMRFAFGRRNARGELEALRARIEHLQQEIAALEASAAASAAVEEAGGAYHAVHDLRRDMANAELPLKRAELEPLLRDQIALEARVGRQPLASPEIPATNTSLRPGAALTALRWKLGLAAVAIFGAVIGVVALISRGGFSPPDQLAQPAVMQLAPFLDAPVAEPGETFFRRQLQFAYAGGRVQLSGDPAPDGRFGVDDGMAITVARPDGTESSWSRTFNVNCDTNVPIEAQDVTGMFQPGLNLVSVALYDACGGSSGTIGPIYLYFFGR